ncbi:hypothetical protein M569_10801, partial [Genlisea aurea]
MVFGAFRSIVRPVVSRILSPATQFTAANGTLPAASPPRLRLPVGNFLLWIPPSSTFHSLTDTRYPKRRPSDKPRRKRAAMKPPGPYVWVKCVPGEPILPNQPNEGSVKRRKEKKRIKQRYAFIMSEKRKRKAQMQEANRKKMAKRVERKMAAVAREKAWAERLIELKKIEEQKLSS